MTPARNGVRPPAGGGVLVLDKPRGPTSHDVVVRVRRAFGIREVGHAGTLDPMATGVLLIAIGEATKLVPWLTAHDKTYEGSIALGVETDTLDADGTELRSVAPSDALRAALRAGVGGGALPAFEAALAAERSRVLQVPPAFSAIKLAGERAFAKARRGERPDLAARPVAVSRLEIVACGDDPPVVDVLLDVAKGYYVRSLARDFALALGTVGHLRSLRRTRSGGFRSEEAISADASPDALLAGLQPLPLAASRSLPVARISDDGERDARAGRLVRPHDLEAGGEGPSAWVNGRGALVAVGRFEQGSGKVIRGFRATEEGASPG